MSGRTGDESARWLGALNKIRKIRTTLLDQQLWCWGQDIRRVEGNALLTYGFTKHASRRIETADLRKIWSESCVMTDSGRDFRYYSGY